MEINGDAVIQEPRFPQAADANQLSPTGNGYPPIGNVITGQPAVYMNPVATADHRASIDSILDTLPGGSDQQNRAGVAPVTAESIPPSPAPLWNAHPSQMAGNNTYHPNYNTFTRTPSNTFAASPAMSTPGNFHSPSPVSTAGGPVISPNASSPSTNHGGTLYASTGTAPMTVHAIMSSAGTTTALPTTTATAPSMPQGGTSGGTFGVLQPTTAAPSAVYPQSARATTPVYHPPPQNSMPPPQAPPPVAQPQYQQLAPRPTPPSRTPSAPPAPSPSQAPQASQTPQISPGSQTKYPSKPAAHGGPTRQYINNNVTPHLLEGMKYLAMYEPEKPLKVLAEFLAKRSKEVEGE
ncbi:hypothetical protein K470DRAFT_279386 [Piedraia hortae CBS 480.64]|uniref:Uncharacterized protein n=1 Tax=Piedraia hortae CBS 480.64 TaxID=1314780 RepID=A0A6A7BS24_9PEZI|nr:hypothetical protein K470DRAFT_279386 [Piedraia hortae CBS 480.64]